VSENPSGFHFSKDLSNYYDDDDEKNLDHFSDQKEKEKEIASDPILKMSLKQRNNF
jgi:hypothetical protein